MAEKTPKMMKANLLRSQATMEVVELPVPECPPAGMIIRARSVGICGSDVIKVKNTVSTEPRVIGHEIAGEVYQLDPRAAYTFKPGDRVAVGHVHIPCMHCHFCRHGSYAMCRSFKTSHVVPGGYSEYVALSAEHVNHSVLPIPDDVSMDLATFIDPVACCLHALNRIPRQVHDHAVVLGVGFMGVLFVQLLRQLHVHVTAIDISDARLEFARGMGAEHVFNAAHPGVKEQLAALTDGRGPDFVVLTVVNQQTIEQSLDWVRDGGWLSLFAGPVQRELLSLDFYDLFRREISLASSYSASPSEMGEALAWIESGKLKLQELITGSCDLAGIYPAIAAMDERSYKVIVHP